MAIDRHQVVETALRLLDQDGLDKLSLRRLAAELGVQAPALYWHFPSKRALLDHMTDAMLAPLLPRLTITDDPEHWPDWLRRMTGLLRDALLAHPDGAAVAQGAGLHRATAFTTFVERTIEVLHQAAGLSLADASRAAGALTQLVIGRTVEEQAVTDITPEEFAALRRGFPALTAAMTQRAQADDADASFRFAVEIMIQGLRAMSPAG